MRKLTPDDVRGKFDAIPIDGATGCKLWTGFRNPSGYGMVRYAGHVRLAHRVAWTLEYGVAPDGLHVCHSCDTPACVNVAHLWVGLDRDNSNDKVGKGRQSRLYGERNGRTKLTPQQREQILLTSGKSADVAAKFGVSSSLVRKIRQQAWTP